MKIVAHRGYSGKYPELSPLAFERALELPIHGVECDVQLTRDGKVIINHDATLDRTSNLRGRIAKMDWEAVREADIGQGKFPGQRIMLLEELLEMTQPTGKHLYIETKHPSPFGDAVEEKTIALLRKAGWDEDPRAHLISFSHRAIHKISQLAPELDRIYLRRDWERHVNRPDVILSNPTGLGLSILRGRMQPSTIGAQGLPTYMWTVDKPEDMKWAWVNGVDILATNQPEVALHAINL